MALEKIRTIIKGPHDMSDQSVNYQELAEQYRGVLERVERVLAFSLRSKIAWGPDYNQAVKDIYDATRTALGKDFIRADDL